MIMENENLTQTQKEIRTLKNILKIYFLAVLVFYVTGGLFQYLKVDIDNDLLINIMFIIFGAPLLASAIYLLRSIYSLWQKNWELFKLSIVNVVIGLIVGAGICGSNLYVTDMLDINF